MSRIEYYCSTLRLKDIHKLMKTLKHSTYRLVYYAKETRTSTSNKFHENYVFQSVWLAQLHIYTYQKTGIFAIDTVKQFFAWNTLHRLTKILAKIFFPPNYTTCARCIRFERKRREKSFSYILMNLWCFKVSYKFRGILGKSFFLVETILCRLKFQGDNSKFLQLC